MSGFFGGLSGHQGALRTMFLVKAGFSEPYLVAVACLSAFVGAFVGARLIHKVTLRGIQILVSVLLTLIACGLLTGLL